MTERQEIILNKVVREYIRTAKPVGSDFLEKKHNLKVCPATIRNEMKDLAEMGYLFQPHTSAGRVPTTKAYRFFVDNILKEFETEPENLEKRKKKQELKQEKDLEFESIKVFVKRLAQQSSGLAFIYYSKNNIFFVEGWSSVLKNPEFEEKEFLEDFLEQYEVLEQRIKKAFQYLEEQDLNICIGRERSILDSENLSLIVSKKPPGNGLLGLLGPSRMPYKENINLIKALIKEYENF